jgi:hypothetical protein
MKKAGRDHFRSVPSFMRLLAVGAAALGAMPALADDPARDYLVQKVCVDQSGNALPTDPYRCESPNRLRPLIAGEALPYHKIDQSAVLRHDSYPAITPQGGEIFVNPFDFTPFGIFNLWGDGYDVYAIREGWVSAPSTQDGGGYSQTFFTEGCKPYNGWVFFPTSALKGGGFLSGNAKVPIAGRYWEQNGDSWPGKCPPKYYSDSLTSWELIKNFPFGGTDPQSTKTIDAIRVVHGLERTPAFARNGHLEVFFFTRLYGLTRWETWVITLDGPAAADTPANIAQWRNCTGAATNISYEGIEFKRKACRDWTVIRPSSSSEPNQAWPVPMLNLLKNFHFGDGTASWNRGGASTQGAETNWSLRNSPDPRDIKYRQDGGQGVRYLAVNCGGECTTGQRIYQDVPLSTFTTSGTYALAATIRAEAGIADVELGLEQLDGAGLVVSTAHFQGQAPERNERPATAGSEYLSSTYVTSDVSVTIGPHTRSLRFYISPKNNVTFDIVNAWLMKR